MSSLDYEKWNSLPAYEKIRRKKFELNKDEQYKELTENICPEVGNVYMVSNRVLGIPSAMGNKHPVILIAASIPHRRALVSPGTDAQNMRVSKWPSGYIVMLPNGTNGLKKSTAFRKIIKEIRTIALHNLIGKLKERDLYALFKELLLSRPMK